MKNGSKTAKINDFISMFMLNTMNPECVFSTFSSHKNHGNRETITLTLGFISSFLFKSS